MVEMLIVEINYKDLHADRRCWLVDIDQGKNHCYRSRASFNSFFYGKKKRNQSPDKVYIAISKHDVDSDYYKNPKKLQSLWDFYLEIGYDYKLKKFGSLLKIG